MLCQQAVEAITYFAQAFKHFYTPALWPSEVISTLRKGVAAGQMTEEDARQSVAGFALLPVQVVLPEAKLLQASLDWAGRMGQIVAYDAQYVAQKC